jgi:hypothetical protein
MRIARFLASAAIVAAPLALGTVAALSVAAPAVAQAEHTVFFALDSARISSDGLAVLDRAAAEHAATGETAVSIVGHTDTTGSADHNMRLSQRRAEAVAAALAERGVPRDAMTLAWRGETELAVQTGDNTLEPRNRRAEVALGGAAAPEPAPMPAASAPLGVTFGVGPYVGFNLEDGDESVYLGGNATARYAVTPNVDLSAEAAVFYNVDSEDDGLGTRLAVGADYVFNEMGGVQPYVGVNGGRFWVDGSSRGGWFAGPEIGVKAGKLEAKVAYDIVEPRDVENGVISLTVSYNFFSF